MLLASLVCLASLVSSVLVLFGNSKGLSDLGSRIPRGAPKGFSNDIESEGLFRTSGNSRSLFPRFLLLVEVFDDFRRQKRIQHVELI